MQSTVPEEKPGEVTELLVKWGAGDSAAPNELFSVVYDELRRLARSYMRRERPGHTLETTSLVHEAYLRLSGQNALWRNRAHFFGVAAQMMRRILVDHAKRRQTAKRGAGFQQLSLDTARLISNQPELNLVTLDGVLERLEQMDPQRGRIVELRFYGGLSNEESAEVLGISRATVQRQWAGARAWLRRELNARGE